MGSAGSEQADGPLPPDPAGRRARPTRGGGSGLATVAELREALLACRRSLIRVLLLSAMISLLMLTGPLFMLLVYDRVLTGRSVPTLTALFLIVMLLICFMGALERYRGRALARIGARFQKILDDPAFMAFVRQAEHPRLRGQSAGILHDVIAIRTALASPGLPALYDTVWTPVFVGALFLFHPWFGWFSLAGLTAVLLIAVLNQLRTRGPRARAAAMAARASARTETIRRDIETVRGLGMTAAMADDWHMARDAALRSSMAASDAGSFLTAAGTTLRHLLQSAILGLGAFLVLRHELSPGEMIAGTILLGRVMMPVAQVIGHWSQLQGAIAAWRNLRGVLTTIPPERDGIELPKPAARLEVTDLTVTPPDGSDPVLEGITFSAGPGDAIAVIGATASGKSCLARALMNLWPPAEGTVRLGGADLHRYGRDRLGQYLGYMPQDVALFDGSVAWNIARLDRGASSGTVLGAVRMAEMEDLIPGLASGHDTPVTDRGSRLSGGQRQHIALARAFHGDPVMLVLDEPDSSLDEAGIRALNRAIGNARAAGRIVVVMSHRPSVRAECNLALHLGGGTMRGFGPRDEIL